MVRLSCFFRLDSIRLFTPRLIISPNKRHHSAQRLFLDKISEQIDAGMEDPLNLDCLKKENIEIDAVVSAQFGKSKEK